MSTSASATSSKARALLHKTFESAARLGAVAPLAEEKVFLAELIEQQRIGEFLDTSGPVRQILRRLRDSGLPGAAFGTTERAVATRNQDPADDLARAPPTSSSPMRWA